jgi:hypothetical protein
MNSNIFYGTVWSEAELRRYRELFDDWKGEQSPLWFGSGDRELLDITNDYPDPSVLISKYTDSLSDRVAAELSNSFPSGYSIDARLSLYNINQSYGWHHDASRTYRHPQNSNWRRIISSITYLNDNFKGGETEFEDQVIIPESGKTLIFPSSFDYPHRGCPVIEGIKKILVLHVWA